MIKLKDVSIVLSGPAGQGIKTAEKMLVSIVKKAGYHVFSTKEYMSRIRGGSNSTTLRISSTRVRALVDRIDILIPLDKDALIHMEQRISPETRIIGEKEKLIDQKDDSHANFIDVPLSAIAKEVGGIIYSNMVVVGIIVGLLKIEKTLVQSYVKNIFAQKENDIIKRNLEAVDKGYAIGLDNASNIKIDIQTKESEKAGSEIMVNGGEAVAMGAVAGGCNFIASYPMSPSTAVLTFLAQHAEQFGIIAEQAEDEIAAINMTLGAWYAGARGLVTTSGGGFALMTEGLSLAGMLETPLVIHLAQRPGPATGLPTRTEQGDLEFVIHAGHGEFSRVILTPGSLEDGFLLTQKAFNLADQYQIPVFILTDQYFMDSYYNTSAFDLATIKNQFHIVKTGENYKRYVLTENGISPRGIPGYGSGLVAVDSDEHDEEGHITENLDLRTKMVDKRLKKMDALAKEAIPPEWIGQKDCDTLVICWGSTFHAVSEAVGNIDNKKMAVLYFKQVYPLSARTDQLLKRAKKLVIVENNATAQFAQVLESRFTITISEKILKYNGLTFSVEELTRRLMEAAL